MTKNMSTAKAGFSRLKFASSHFDICEVVDTTDF